MLLLRIFCYHPRTLQARLGTEVEDRRTRAARSSSFGSEDYTQTFLNDWVKEFVRSIRTEGVSGPTARQIGAEAARGDVLYFFDAHILVAHDFFNKTLRTIRDEAWETLGTIHFPICWNGVKPDNAGTHYKLTLEKNF